MEKELFDFVSEHAQVLSSADSAKQETQEAAKAWLEAAQDGPESAALDEATTTLVDFLEGRPGTIDGVIAFAKGPAVQMMGEEAAQQFLAAQLQRKEEGARWCNCPACSAATQILAKFDRIEL